MKPDLFDAIVSLAPNANFCMRGDDIEWVVEPNVKPTEKELNDELIRLQTEYTNKDYHRKRASEYPPITDYLDGIVKGDLVQQQDYIDACLAVKVKYPKEAK